MPKVKASESGNITRNSLKFNLILFIVLFIAVIALFHEFVFSDQMLYGSDTIQAGVFFRSFYVDYMAEYGKVPVWNPYQFCGIPYIDAFHGDTFYPFSVLKFYIDIYRALGWNLLLHVFIAGITMFACARVFKRSQMAATLAAVGYMFAAYFVSQVAPGHDGKMFVTALFPLTIMLIELAFRKRSLLCFSLLGLTIGVIILTPHPQMAYYTLWACAFYFVFKLLDRFFDDHSIAAIPKMSGLFVMAVVIGLAISAIHFYPGYTYVKNYSPRSDVKRGENWAKSWSLHPEETVSLIVPEFCGTRSGSSGGYWGRNPFKDNSEYAGVIPFLLALIALVMVRSRKTWFFGGMALFAVIYGLSGNTWFFYLFYNLIPNVKSTRAWSMIMFLFSFSISLLAAFGLDFIIEKSRQLRDQSRRAFTLALFGLPGIVLLGALFFATSPETAIGLYKSIFYGAIPIQKSQVLNVHLDTIASGFWKTFLFLIIPALAVWLYSRKKVGLIILWVVIAFAFADAYRFDRQFIRTYDKSISFSKSAITEYFNSIEGKYRVLNLAGGQLPTNYLPFFGIEEMTSSHGNQPRWYDNLLGGSWMGNKLNLNLMNMTNTKYLLISPASQVRGDQLTGAGFRQVKQLQSFQVFENPFANERAYLVHDWVVEADEEKMRDLILRQSFDTKNQVGLFESPGIEPVIDSTLLITDKVVIDRYENDYIALTSESSAAGLIVLADNWYPAWKAFVDGEESPVYRANASFRAVVLSAGKHKIEFKYISDTQKTGRWLTILALLSVGLIATFDTIRHRRNKS